VLSGIDCDFRKKAYTSVLLEFGNVMFLMYKRDTKIRVSAKLAKLTSRSEAEALNIGFIKKKNVTAHPIFLISVCKNNG